MLFYRFISENLTEFLNAHEHRAGVSDFDFAQEQDGDVVGAMEDVVKEKFFFIFRSVLFANVRATRNGRPSSPPDERSNLTRSSRPKASSPPKRASSSTTRSGRAVSPNREPTLRTSFRPPPDSAGGNGHAVKKRAVLAKLLTFFDRYSGLT